MKQTKITFKFYDKPQTRKEIEDALQLRRTVFVEEQGYPLAVNNDGLDSSCLHLVLYADDEAAATARLIENGDGLLGSRFCVLKKYRVRGFGVLLVKRVLKYLNEETDKQFLEVYTKPHLMKYYKAFGAFPTGQVHFIGGSIHIVMRTDRTKNNLKN